MSVFLAVDLDEPTRARTAALIETHRGTVEAAKWLRTDKLHCTVLFLGNPPAEQVAQWIPSVDRLAARHHPFSLCLEGAGTFVTARAPSVLWLGVGGEVGPLTGLYRDALRVFGGEERPFVPHVTLARARGVDAFAELARQLNAFESPDFGIESLALYSSSSEVYRVVHRVKLG